MTNKQSASRIIALICTALASYAASAQTVKCDTDPVQCFIDQVKLVQYKPPCDIDVTRWQINAASVYRYSGSGAVMPEKPNIHRCIEEQKSAVEPYYKAAREYLANNKDGLSALKDAYSYWLTSTDLLPDGVFLAPSPANIKANQMQREHRDRALAEKLNRLLIEK